MKATHSIAWTQYAGLGMVTLATLMFELLLTRIFSVTMWYHFGFMAVSIALFGMTAGAIVVYLLPQVFTPERAHASLALSTSLFAVFIVISFLIHANIPLFVPGQPWIIALILTYVLISIPFVFSGISVSIALTRLSGQVSKLYAADLTGAALGCLLIILALQTADGPTAVMLSAFFAMLGALLFSIRLPGKVIRAVNLSGAVLLGAFVIVNTILVQAGSPLIRLKWVKGAVDQTPLYERWNSFSRVAVLGDPNAPEAPFGFGISQVYPLERRVRQLRMVIDANADTQLTAFDGDMSQVDFLKYDVTNIAHYIRPDARVLVVGAGGSRDILAALAFDQKSVVGVEMNENIMRLANGPLGAFTGHLDRDTRITYVVDEARSYISRQVSRYDIIQISLIDTWAATTAGAFVLTEHSLYTTEAWKIFLDHLWSKGILSVSRWYFPENPWQTYRAVTLAVAALGRIGVEDARSHILILTNMPPGQEGMEPFGIGTILVSKDPFSAEDLKTIQEKAGRFGFNILLSPVASADPILPTLFTQDGMRAFIQERAIDITPPTDDRPFFFYMVRLADIFRRDFWAQKLAGDTNILAISILGVLLFCILGLTILSVIVPLLLTTRRIKGFRFWTFLLYFGGIGLGYIMVEISQMQRLSVFLGHPTYSLSVVLFTLLISSGLGSYTTHRIEPGRQEQAVRWRLLLLLLVLVLFGLLTPTVTQLFQGAVTPVRILVAAAMLLPLGFLMGMAFPLGMRLAQAPAEAMSQAALAPWFWGVNGAMSVTASVLSVVIGMSAGISTAFWTGSLGYAAAFLALMRVSRRG